MHIRSAEERERAEFEVGGFTALGLGHRASPKLLTFPRP